MSLQTLLDAGFERIGAWRLAGRDAGMELDGTADRKPGVYAFVVDGVVQHVGSAQRGLHVRFRRYATSQTMRTSARIRSNIIACLKTGTTVDVYALQPRALEWRSLPVDLVAGLGQYATVNELAKAENMNASYVVRTYSASRCSRPTSSKLSSMCDAAGHASVAAHPKGTAGRVKPVAGCISSA